MIRRTLTRLLWSLELRKPGPNPDGIPDLTNDEADAYTDAINPPGAPMPTAARTPLAEGIAQAHPLIGSRCGCGLRGLDSLSHTPHVTTVTEQAVRERIAAELEQRARHLDPDEYTGGPAYSSGVRYGLSLAADIAKGTTP